MTAATSQLHRPAVLANAAEQALSWMTELPDRLAPSEIHTLQHSDMAQRVRSLAVHLPAVLLLAQGDNYPSAFALLRVALEHHLVDELIFRGQHHRQVF